MEGKTPEQRVIEFPEKFIVQSAKLKCRACNKFIDHVRRDTILDHLKSQKHIKNENVLNQQINLYHQVTNETAIIDFIKMCTAADIPLSKRDKMEPWLSKYVNLSGALPMSNTLQSYWLPRVMNSYNNELTDKLENSKFVSLCVDGTTDNQGKKLLNTVVYAENLEVPLLGFIDFLETEDNTTISSSINKFITNNKI